MLSTDPKHGAEINRGWQLASWHMLAWVLACAGYVVTVTTLAPAHKITVVNTVGFLGPQTALLTWFTLLARSVRRGQRQRAALWGMSIYTCLGTVTVLMAIFTFDGGRAAIPHAVAWGIVIVTAVMGVLAILRASTGSAQASADR